MGRGTHVCRRRGTRARRDPSEHVPETSPARESERSSGDVFDRFAFATLAHVGIDRERGVDGLDGRLEGLIVGAVYSWVLPLDRWLTRRRRSGSKTRRSITRSFSHTMLVSFW